MCRTIGILGGLSPRLYSIKLQYEIIKAKKCDRLQIAIKSKKRSPLKHSAFKTYFASSN